MSETVNGFVIERYSSKDSGFRINWPTGFSGHGHSCTAPDGLVTRHAWRLEALVAAGVSVEEIEGMVAG